MRNPSLIFCIGLIFNVSVITGQINNTAFQAPKSDNSYLIPSSSSEVKDKRDLYQKAYKTTDGRIIYQFSKAPLHYKDANGNWLPIDFKPTATSHGFIADKQNNPVALGYDGSVEIANSTGSILTLSTLKIFDQKIKDEPIENQNLDKSLITGKNQLFNYLTEDVVQRSEFRHNGIKIDYILGHSVNWGDGTIRQQLICDPSWQIVKHKTIEYALSLLNQNGDEMCVLYPIVCKDASSNFSLGEYTYSKNATGYSISLQISKSWLESTERIYPIVIDPLIIGPTSLWPSAYMPGCLMPLYNVDSLPVTIPGLTTITGVFCSGSYYADPFSGAIKAEGFMHFSTTCGATADLSVYPPTTGWNTAGTAYGTDIDYRNPLSCCVGPSCVDRIFYVRMHLGRNAGGPGCTTNYIYYDPFQGFPFSVYVEGRTPEPTGSQVTVTPAIICSDQCSLDLKPFVRYGVPPFTVTHPWATGPINMGTPVYTCALNGVTTDIPLTRPGCPIFCDTATSVTVPVPTIVDACGTAVTGFPTRIVTIKPTPQITVATDSILVCSNSPVLYPFIVCPAGTTVNWSTPGFTGTNTIDTIYNNPGPGVISTQYTATATLNGCTAAPQTISYYTSPNPQAAFTNPSVGLIDEPLNFVDMSTYIPSSGNTWLWTFGDGGTANDSMPTHSYSAEGTYNVCLFINSDFGCKDTICDTVKIIPNKLILPNIITTNNDGLNDALYFQYLPYYGTSTLQVYNRWGEIVYESIDYKNDWAPANLTEGTYFYIIKIPGQDPYTSTLNVFSKP
jgi:hypothetical protein